MKRLLFLFFTFSLFFSCKQKIEEKKKAELTLAEKENLQFKKADGELKYNKEKIVLLANIKGIHYDTLYSILKDYYYKVDGDNENDTAIQTSLNYTTAKHKFPKSKIASFIFSFKYEMLSKEEIIENEIENNEP